jgi:hypothetical protein
MHRLLMQPPAGMEVGHVNGDGLDNRRVNLRVCDPRENRRGGKYGVGVGSKPTNSSAPGADPGRSGLSLKGAQG